MIRKILVYENALAEQHPALQRALQLARCSDRQLKVIDVVDGPSDARRELSRPMRSLIEQDRKDRLDAIVQPMREQDIQLTTELIRGRPFVEIVREVVHEGFHLVIKAAANTQSTGVMGILGSVDMRLIRNCPCPVWLEAPGHDLRLDRILIAIDPQAEDDELNKVLLELGTSLAKMVGAELHVVGAWDVPDEDFLMENMHAKKLALYRENVRAAAEESLDALLVHAGQPAIQSDVHIHQGDPARTILDCVESHRPDILLIGTVGHANVPGLLVGNTADTVLRQINCSVLAVRPDRLLHA